MNKNIILQKFGEDDRAEVINLYEKFILSKDRDISIFGNNFYSPNIWKYFEKFLTNKDFKVSSYGLFEEAERKMIAFNNRYDIPFPLKKVKIVTTSKFNMMSHKDYLGAILALGIKRNKMGDLLVKDNCCYLPVCEGIHEFIVSNLTSVGNSPCLVQVLEDSFISPEPVFNEMIILVPSLRIDTIVAKLCNISRGKAQNTLDGGKVLIDYNTVKSKGEEVRVGQRITIKGTGKFILGDIAGNSKSGKFKVKIKKYT
jgi:RNA-binding protein YlmH